MANENEQMAEFADNLWKNFIKPKIEQNFKKNVSFYKAVVTANTGNGYLTVQKPYDNQITIHCNDALKDVAVGTQVLVLCFGEDNLKNHIAFTTGGFKKLYESVTATDEKVKQENLTENLWHPLLMGKPSNASSSSIPTTTVTDQAYFNASNPIINPSTGELKVGSITPDSPVAIASGGTGASTASSALTNLGAMPDGIHTASSTGNSLVERSGNVVCVHFKTGSQTWSASDTLLSWTVPTGYRPPRELTFPVIFVGNAGQPVASTHARGKVNTDGTVYVYPQASVTGSAIGVASWVCHEAMPS